MRSPYMKPYVTLEEAGDFVVLTSPKELAYFMADCDEQGRSAHPWLRTLRSFPCAMSTNGHIVGWTDRMDRVLPYITFEQYTHKSAKGRNHDQPTDR